MKQNMDPLTFHKIDEGLERSEVDQLKFLCMDLIPKKRLETVNDAKELFMRLDEQTLLDDKLLIPELLITIGRNDLLGILGMSKADVERNLQQRDASSKGVSAYRKMLFRLSEDMTEDNLGSVKFLVKLPKAKLGRSATFLDVMIEMEKLQNLGEDNLDELYNILDKCDKQLACRIQDYRAQEQGGRLPLREVFPNVPVSLPGESMPGHTGEYYNVTQRPLGYCLIINNFNFKKMSPLSNRTGTDKDRASEMKDVIRQFAKEDHTRMGAFVCCVLSHGEKGTVLGIDAKEVEIRELTKPIAECHTLATKPKLFFIQACQGSVGQNGVWTTDAPDQNPTEEDPYEDDAYNPACRSIPIEADMLIGMATVEHYQSFRHTREGSIYIQELCHQLEQCCPRKEDILSILTKVNHEVSLKILKGCKQMPEPRYTLTRKLMGKTGTGSNKSQGNQNEQKKLQASDGSKRKKTRECYSMSKRPLGHCLIINNFNFEGTSLGNRRGTDKDKDDLTRVFQNMFFKVEVRDDLQASDMLTVIKEFAERDHSQMDAFVCCILSHGKKGSVLGTDGIPVPISELTQLFAECRTLVKKPKIFFIQACQDNEAQQGVLIADGLVKTTEEGTFEQGSHTAASHSVHKDADFLIGIATVESYKSFRHVKDGSIFIQELCKQLESGCRSKQMPEVRYTLTKTLVLPMQ
ncbi:Caspase-8 [Labeo rohita]|uniref:Caspase-8 n=1 Tax=Labeo rohita TaxID=84645 RepID=A0ABQ8MKG1_LABRO|nr:Caspase-8 [Labeo rohita]